MQWEKYQPVELYAVDEAQQWRREADAKVIANEVALRLFGSKDEA